ncbi:hypothetical protein M1D88_12620 [Arthrobacter sp. R1-13]
MANAAVGQVTQSADEVRVEVSGAAALSGAARDVFDSAIKSYATELLNEASRRELAHRADSSTVPQFTTGQVAIAEQVVRSKGLAPPARSRWFIVAKALMYLLAVLIGVSSNLMVQSEPWFLTSTGWLVVFCVSGTAALCLTIVTEAIEFNKER